MRGSVYYRLASTPWGSGLMSALLFGVFMAVLVAVGGASLPATMLATGLAAATLGILMGLLPLSQLSVSDGLPRERPERSARALVGRPS